MCGLDRSGGGFGGTFQSRTAPQRNALNAATAVKVVTELHSTFLGRSYKRCICRKSNTIVVLISSFPYAINWSQANVPAILHITHAAQEQGTAIAEVLFGDYNPAGRLVQTWPTGLASAATDAGL